MVVILYLYEDLRLLLRMAIATSDDGLRATSQ